MERVGGVLGESVERAKAWREAEKQRVEAIHHNANSDMEGRPNDEHHKESKAQKIANKSFARFFLAKVLFWGKFHENISIKKLRTLIKINKIA